MSDEEKEAIKSLRLNVTNVGFSVYDGTTGLFKMRDIQIVLNLIEKQSKEIEEYKKQLDLDYVDKHFVPIERYYQLEKEIEELKEKNENLLDALNNSIDIRKYWVSKDKIKAKIDKIQSRIDQMHPASDCVIIDDLENQIEVLQSLLEKED